MKTLEERFWEKVDKTGDCWVWTGATSKGYRKISVNGKMQLAHRVSYELYNGDIPEGEGHHGMCCLHRCDTPACVNPAHLFLGTQPENVRDMEEKGRAADKRGEKNGRAKLTNHQIPYIKELWKARVFTQAKLAEIYGVSTSLINGIVNNKMRRHI